MALKVLGWDSYDSHDYPAGEYSEEVRSIVLMDVKRNGYLFTGLDHQESINCAPVLTDGKIYRFSQRGWGALMATAHGSTDYSLYACGTLNSDAREEPALTMDYVVHEAAEKVLSKEELDYLFEDGYTFRYPQEGLGEREIYTLKEEEHKTLDKFGIYTVIRQVPKVLCDYLFTDK